MSVSNVSKKVRKPSTSDIKTVASEAIAAVQKATNTIPIDHVTPQAALADRVAYRVPDEAMTIAANVLEANPKRFPDYDPKVIRSALAYEQAVVPLGVLLASLAQTVHRSVVKRKGDAATQTLGLYSSLKGISKTSSDDPILDQQRSLQKLLTTTKKSRATSVTVGEADAAVKQVKKTKVAAAKAAAAASAMADANEAAEAAGTATSAQTTPPASPAASPTVATAPAVVIPGH
jgi:hypothetical protein